MGPAVGFRFAAVAALVPLVLIWGYNWVVMKVGIEASEPFTFAALTAVLGGICLFVLLLIVKKPLWPRPFGHTLLLGLLQTAGFMGLAMLALKNGAAGKTSVLAYTMPFWLILFAWIVLAERLRGTQWVAVTIALTGLVVVLSPWQSSGTLTSSLLAVGAGMSWAAGVVVAKIIQRRHVVDLLSLTTWQMLLGSIPLMIAAAYFYPDTPIWSPEFAVSLSYNVLLGSALGYSLWMYVVRALPAGTAGVSLLAVPVVGLVSAWIQLGERPPVNEAVGVGLILFALALLTVRGLVAERSREVREPILQEGNRADDDISVTSIPGGQDG